MHGAVPLTSASVVLWSNHMVTTDNCAPGPSVEFRAKLALTISFAGSLLYSVNISNDLEFSGLLCDDEKTGCTDSL